MAKQKKKKQNKTPSPDLNDLFTQIAQFNDRYRFFLAQLGEISWQALFQRMDTTALLGDVSATGSTPGEAIQMALVLVRSQDE